MDARETKIRDLSWAIYTGFIKPDDGEYLRMTGSIVSYNSLRVKKTREALRLMREAVDHTLETRIWTKAALRDSLKHMVRTRFLEIPLTNGFSFNDWLKEQVNVLHPLAQKARKNAWLTNQLASMDNLETQPWLPAEHQDTAMIL